MTMHFSQTNPPFHAPLVELVPSPWADSDVLPKAKAVMEKIGQVPVILKKEIEGFVLNRIQYSILKESWRLIKVICWFLENDMLFYASSESKNRS